MSNEEPKIRTYETLKTEAMALRKSADGCDWGLGDLCLELDYLLEDSKIQVKKAKEDGEEPDPLALEFTREGKNMIKRLAADIGVGVEYLDARRRVSARIPKDGPLSWIRDSALSFTHCRALYPIKDDAELDAMANKGLSLTVEQLRNEVDVLQDRMNIKSGLYECSQCKSSIDEPEHMFSIRREHKKTLICSVDCLRTYVDSLDSSNEDRIDPFEEAERESEDLLQLI